ncbi:hypothetical protein LCGC14_0422030 [marine sediment metagenome]|uniref:Uncharacterized protein n=1 Tax=marine sediment metagenome TaxID=412755 RepID=A0A0F9VZT5_9ZZZZ
MGRSPKRRTKRKSMRPKKLSMKNAFKGIRTVGAPSGRAMKRVGDAMAAGTRIRKKKGSKMMKTPRFI